MKKIALTVTFLYALSLTNAQSPTFQWAKNIGGYYGHAIGKSIAVDGSGNVFTTGTFAGRVDFDPGVGNFYLTAIGYYDAFVTKKNASGNLIWAKQLSGDADGNSIAISPNGNICIAGTFAGTVDFDPGVGVYNLTSAGSSDDFICMLNASGNLIWSRQFGNTGQDIAVAVTTDASNNVYTAGNFSGNVDFDPGTGSFNLYSAVTNGFISKLNSQGNFVWVKQIAGNSFLNIISLAIDFSGNIYTTGNFLDSIDCDPGVSTFNLTSTGSADIFISKLNIAGNFLWAKHFGGSEWDNVNSIKTDAAGNVYTVGSFRLTVDFDPGPGVNNLTSAGYGDLFVSKLDASGNHLWAKRIGGSSDSEGGNSIFLDYAGNFYTTGRFYATVDFDPGLDTFNLVAYYKGAFVLKLNSSGNFVWAKAVSGTDEASGTSISGDSASNVFTTGYFEESCDFDPGAGLFKLYALGNGYMFTLKLDASGNFIWAKSIGTGSSAIAKSMTTDLFGNVYATGDFYGTVDFDPGPGTFNLSTALTDVKGDVFVTKCNSSGNLIWAKKLGGLAHDYVNAIAVDASGNVYTVGSFKQTADFNPGPGAFNLTSSSTNYDIFVSKLNASGNFVWAKKLGSTSMENVYSIALDASGNLFLAGRYFSGTNSYQIYLNKIDASGNLVWSIAYGGTLEDVANAIATDAAGNIYITGYFAGTTDLNPGTGVYNLTAMGNIDIFVSKLDGAGNFIWAKQMGGVNGNSAGSVLKLDSSGKIYISGYFNQTTDFDPGPGIYNLTSTGSADIFISKLDNIGNFIWAKQFVGSGSDYVRSIDVDYFGNVYTAGTFFGTTDFDPGAGTFNLTSQGQDGFISKVDSSGILLWAQQLGGAQNEQMYSIDLDGSNNIYSCGTFTKTVDFDPSLGVLNLTANGNPDFFIHKMGSCIPLSILITPMGSTTFCSGGSVILNANTGTGLTYQWQKNGVSISGATASSYVATTAGSYSVVESNSVSCLETSNNIIVNVPCIPIDPNEERIEQLNELDSEIIQVYPNPTSGIFIIDSPNGKLEIFNIVGEQIYSMDLYGNERNINLSNYSNGIYILIIRTEKKTYTQKLMLSH